MTTPLSDPDNVLMTPVENVGGFTDDEVSRWLNGESLPSLTAAGDFDEVKHPRDRKGKFAKNASSGSFKPGKKITISKSWASKNHDEGVVAVNANDSLRIEWTGTEFQFHSKKTGTWQKTISVDKAALVELYGGNDDVSEWFEPISVDDGDGSNDVATQPTNPKPAVTSKPAPESKSAAESKTYSASQRAKVQAIFARHNLKWHNKSDAIYDAAQEVSTTHPDLTMSDALDIMDQSLQKKTGNPFRTKIEKWLQTGAGKKHVLAKGGSAPAGSTTSATPSVTTSPATKPASGASFARLSASQADAMQAEMNAAEPPPWTLGQSESLRRYTGNDYKEINGCARGADTCNPQVTSTLNSIKSALKSSTRDFTVFRQTTAKSFGLTSPNDFENLVGKTIKDDGITSTSIRTNLGWEGNVRLDIEVPKGTKVAWIKSVSHHPDEDEMILEPGTHYEVVGVKKYKDKYGKYSYHVKLRVTPSDR